MRTKIIITLTTCLFAVVSVANMHLAQNNHNTDISLADISVMAQADGESGGEFKYCYTASTAGGIMEITPCLEYNPDYLPPYRCGTPIEWCWPGGKYEQCTDTF